MAQKRGKIEDDDAAYDYMKAIMKETTSKRPRFNNNVMPASDIIQEVYLRLPYKSLVRFKTLCKQLYNLTNDRYFINKFRTLHLPDQSTLVVVSTDKNHAIQSLFLYALGYDNYTFKKSIVLPKNKDFKGLVSSYGLLCLYGYGGGGNRKLAVCNHTAQEIVHLPDYHYCLPSPDDFYLNRLGFGFHPKINKYKIVQLVRDANTRGILGCNVLTLELDSGGADRSKWKYVAVDDVELLKCNCNYNSLCHPKEVIRQDLREQDKPAVCAGGVLYWEIYSRPRYEDILCILLFDLSSEKMKMISPPPPLLGRRVYSNYQLAELQGILCFWEMFVDNGNTLRMDIWKLNHQSDCHTYYWSHLYTLRWGQSPDSKFGVGCGHKSFSPMCIMDEGRRILLRNGDAFYCYDTLLEDDSCSSSRRGLRHRLKVYQERNGDVKFPNWCHPCSYMVHGETTVTLAEL